MTPTFTGFSKETIQFLIDLSMNNSKTWFDANKDRYEQHIIQPAKNFVSDMGEKLRTIAPNIHAEPRVNHSLFRLNRDIRFSPDKTPYKTYVGILFWEGSRKRMESPGFYLQINPKTLMIGGGMHQLPKDLLEPYRQLVSQEKPAKQLAVIVDKLKSIDVEIGGLHYKKTPREYSENHPYAYFLKYTGVYTMKHMDIPKEFFEPTLIDFLFQHFKLIVPLNQWFIKNLIY